jgi:hypothetical protein
MFISELANNAKALDPLKLFAESVEENKEYIVDLNTGQLGKGRDSKNASLFPYANDDYAKFKKSIGSEAPLGTPNLKLTGEFWSGFNVKTDKEGLVISSTDSKSEKLKSGYGEDIFGLTDESKKDLKTMLLPTYLEKLKDELLRK